MALDDLRASAEAAPSTSFLKEIHQTIFDAVLVNAGEFRENAHAIDDGKGQQLCPKADIDLKLMNLALKHYDLLRLAKHERDQGMALKDGETIKKLADYHSELMRLKPFQDVVGSNFVNQTVALIVLESQIEHCFPAYKHQNRKAVSAAEYQQALEWSHHSPSLQDKLRNVVKNLSGQPDNVFYLTDNHRKQEFGHSH